MRFRLRTLLIVLALGPAVLAAPWLATAVDKNVGLVRWNGLERYLLISAVIDLFAGAASGLILTPCPPVRLRVLIYGVVFAFAIMSYCMIAGTVIEGNRMKNGIDAVLSLWPLHLCMSLGAAPISAIVQLLRARVNPGF
jgi:hypothetical protein